MRLVKDHGANTGSWTSMAEIFSSKFEGSTRSAGSLRGRWQRLEDEAAAVGTTVVDMRITLWHETDKVVIQVRTSHLQCLRVDGSGGSELEQLITDCSCARVSTHLAGKTCRRTWLRMQMLRCTQGKTVSYSRNLLRIRSGAAPGQRRRMRS